MVFYWLIAALCCVAFELGSPGLFLFLSFAIGALGGAFAAAVNLGFDLQLASFLVATVIGFGVLRKFSKKIISKNQRPTNYSAMLGRQGIIKSNILLHQTGQVLVGGEIWTARSLHQKEIKENQIVKVSAIKGCHLIVEAVQDLKE